MDKKKAAGTFFFTLFIVLCVCAIIYGGMKIFQNIDTKSNGGKEETTASLNDEKNDVSKMTFLCDIDSKNEISVYTQNKNIYLSQKSQLTQFNWTGSYKEGEVYGEYADFDGDGENEIAILLPKTNDENNKLNDIHILDVKNVNGKYKYTDFKLESNSAKWNLQLDFQATQLENKKRVSFILNDNQYYFKAPSNDKGIYYSFENMEIGQATYTLKDNIITAKILLVAGYTDNDEPIKIGNINSKVIYDGELGQYVFSDLTFESAKEYAISAPTDGSTIEPWSMQIKNFNVKSSNRLKISDIDFVLDANDTDYRDFDTGITQEKYVSYIEISESYIKLAVTKNMQFDSFWLENGGCTVWLGDKNGYYINSYSELTSQDDYNYITTYFDEKISKEQFAKLAYHFGEEN